MIRLFRVADQSPLTLYLNFSFRSFLQQFKALVARQDIEKDSPHFFSHAKHAEFYILRIWFTYHDIRQ